MKNLIVTLFVISCLSSCVPLSKLEDTRKERDNFRKENDSLKVSLLKETNDNTILNDSTKVMFKKMESLKIDTGIYQNSIRRLTYNYDQINKTYELLVKEKKQLLEGNENEKKGLIIKLAETQNELNNKAEQLQKLENEITLKKNELINLQNELEKNKKELDIKDKSLVNLENVLNRQDSIVKALKKNVSKALLGFENNGLTIQIKNSKVYVSLDENLLFASGSTVVDKKGIEALGKLGKVLEQNTEINIMIEGHTDNVPYNGKGEIKDNWDLSAMRATSVAKILLKGNKIDQKRITVAGRSEYFPVDEANTPDARQKNRRTEIILTPKLDELFNIINSN